MAEETPGTDPKAQATGSDEAQRAGEKPAGEPAAEKPKRIRRPAAAKAVAPDAGAGDAVGEQTATEVAREPAHDRHRQRGRGGGQQSQAPQRVAEKGQRDLGDHGDQRGLVDVPPCEVSRARDKV